MLQLTPETYNTFYTCFYLHRKNEERNTAVMVTFQAVHSKRCYAQI